MTIAGASTGTAISVVETLRGLLTGTPIGNKGIDSVAWCLAIALGGYLRALGLYYRNSAR